MHRHVVVCAFFALFCGLADSKIFTPCELATEMSKPKYNVSFWQIPTWVCLAYRMTGFDSSYADGIHYGIFRLSGRHWCSRCGVTCDKFLDDDIEDDINCVVNVIYKEHDGDYQDGFSGWWNEYQRRQCATPGSFLQEHDCNAQWNLEIKEVARNPSSAPEAIVDFDIFTNSSSAAAQSDSHCWSLHRMIIGVLEILLVIVLCAFAAIGVYEIWRKRQLPFTMFYEKRPGNTIIDDQE